MRQQPKLSFLDINLNQRNNYCPFVRTGSMAVAWHGGVSPCPALLHSYRCFIRGRKKISAVANSAVCPEQPLHGDLVESGVCGLSGACPAISTFRPARIAGGAIWRRKTKRIASAIPSPSAATACGRAAFCAAHKNSEGAFGGMISGERLLAERDRSEAEIRNRHLKNKTKYGESYNENE